MATDGIFVDGGHGVVRMNLAAVSLAHYSVRVGKSATTPLQVLASIAREECNHKAPDATLIGKVDCGMVWVFGTDNAVYKLYCEAFGLSTTTAASLAGKQWYVRVPELLAEIALRKDAENIVQACNKKRKAYQTITSGIPLADAQLMRRADNLVPNWRELKAENRLAPIVDALRRLQAGSTPATVAKAASPVPPVKAHKPAPKPQPAPTPAPVPATPAPTGQGELSAHARALVDALAKIGGPAIKATMLQTAGIPVSAWSDALSEAYRARKITRDRARTDNVYHILAK